MRLFSKEHNYLVSYIIPEKQNNPNLLGFGNATLTTAVTGKTLISQAIECATSADPHAIVMSISKVD